MTASEEMSDDLNALNELVVNCPDFEHLESLLGGFNLFQVLKFEHGEIRHSNVLAWILDPSESHGLDASFLKKWLMRVIHEASDLVDVPIAPVDIDCWQLLEVDVRREWNNIDVLLLLNFSDGSQWVISIENKLNSSQHSNQLTRYRTLVEREFPAAAQKIYVFLTKNPEQPEDDHYIPASYSQVHKVLKECLGARQHAIGEQPMVLLENYLRLLEEKFMNESEIARTAMRIYQQHRRALDIIFEHRPDNLSQISGHVRELLEQNADKLDLRMEACTKAYIRFIPKAWDQVGNTHGSAWSGVPRTLLFEMNLTGKRPYLYAIAGKAPDAWIEPIWTRASTAPFNRPKKSQRPKFWCSLHLASRTQLSLNDEDSMETAERAQRIFDWCAASLTSADTAAVIRILAEELPRLETIYSQKNT